MHLGGKDINFGFGGGGGAGGGEILILCKIYTPVFIQENLYDPRRGKLTLQLLFKVIAILHFVFILY